jgi:hypothetical protein
MLAAAPMSEAFAHRYKLLDRIAIGGTAEVFRAIYVTADGSERPVVIKRVLPQFARDERFRRLFHEEACVAVTMTHPSIVRVLDHGELGPTCYIALELVEGKDLGSLLEAATRTGQKPSARLCAYVTAQVAEALEFIHGQTSSEGTPLHIIHRDVSPQNILVSYSGDVKLTDFGIAKSAIRREQTVDGTLRGKLDYMAPEQARLQPVDHRADIFALGCVLYEMLHGAPPCRGENELDTLERAREGRIAVAPEQLAAPPALQRVLARALAADAAARYQSAAEMAADLRAYLQEVSSPSPENLGRWMREVEAVPVPEAGNRVDDAVRRLLGGEEPDQVPDAPAGTTVFASSSDAVAARPVGAAAAEARSAAAEARSAAGARRLQIALGVLLLLALSGWVLWAVSPGTVPGGAREAGAPRPRRDALPPLRLDRGAVRPAAPDAAPVAKGSGKGKDHGRNPPRGEKATLTINTLPWSRVRLDGKLVGNTPLVRLSVRAGNHRLELLAPDGTVRKTLSVSLAPGGGRSFTFDFTSAP